MAVRVCEAALVLLVVAVRVSSAFVCPVNSAGESVLGSQDLSCPLHGDESTNFVAVVEGDEVSLQRALSLADKNNHGYVALLFYASWCPFSGSFRSTFSILSTLYPSIPHFAIEESVIRQRILAKFGVHGFPTIFLVNSTMRLHYHGSRTLGSLVAFYNDVTGLETAPLAVTSLEKIRRSSSSDNEKHNSKPGSCPFSLRATSPENVLMFRQETYLALATAFVLLRLLYFIFPTQFVSTIRLGWSRYAQHIRLRSLWDSPLAYLNRAIQLLFNSLKEPPCDTSNLQEGAMMNAKLAWASKSLASVSFGDATTSSRVVPVS